MAPDHSRRVRIDTRGRHKNSRTTILSHYAVVGIPVSMSSSSRGRWSNSKEGRFPKSLKLFDAQLDAYFARDIDRFVVVLRARRPSHQCCW
jgi:hypothetical protein